VRVRLVANTAVSPNDFDDKGGRWRTIRFRPTPGTGLTPTTKVVTVPVAGDVVTEEIENLRVVLSDPTPGWSIGRAWGLGSIRDTDPVATGDVDATDVRMSDATVVEGDAGDATRVRVWLTLPQAPLLSDVRFDYVVSSLQATAGVDYVARAGHVTFQVGQTRKSVVVMVGRDQLAEEAETITVGPMSSGGPSGYITILDDD
jgi:hypothetical protein